MNRLVILASSLWLCSCQTAMEGQASLLTSATIASPSGQSLGEARLFRQAQDLTMNVWLEGLPPGSYALQLHDGVACGASLSDRFGLLPDLSVPLPEGRGTISVLITPEAVTALPSMLRDKGLSIAVMDAGQPAQPVACGSFGRG